MSKSQKRVMTKLLGLRLSQPLWERLALTAKKRGTSPTSLAREIIADDLEFFEELRMRKTPVGRGPTRPSDEAMAVLQFMGELGREGNNLNQSVAQIHLARKSGDLSEQMFRELQVDIHALLDLHEKILAVVTKSDDQ